MNLEDKVALVTGGASGVGKAISLKLARDGANVIIGDILEKDANDVCRQIVESLGKKSLAIKVDVSSSNDVVSMINEIIKEFGKLDILIANAGTEQKASSIIELNEEEWERVMDINAKGAFLCCKYAVREMIKGSGKGKIVLISSINSNRSGSPWYGAYAASKSAIIGLASTLTIELAPYKINVNVICPGIIDTSMLRRIWEIKAQKMNKSFDEIMEVGINSVPLKRLGKPEDIANCVAFLVSNDADYINGAVIDVTGGLREVVGGRG